MSVQNSSQFGNLGQITVGLSGLTSDVMNELLQLRNELEIEDRNLVKETNSDLELTAEDQAHALSSSTIAEGESMLQQGIGDLSGSGMQGALGLAGEGSASSIDTEISTATNKQSDLADQIKTKTEELGHLNIALGPDAPADAVLGNVQEQTAAKKELDDLRSQYKQAGEEVQHKENMKAQALQRFNVFGQTASGLAKGTTQITASQEIKDKAAYDAAGALLNYSQKVMGTMGDNLAQMANAQSSEARDISQTQDAIRSAGVYHG